jgi:putative transposase
LGGREILGIDVSTAEDRAWWLTFLWSLTGRGVSGVKLVTSDAHAGLVAAIEATLAGPLVAALQNALPDQSDGCHSEELVAVGAHSAALGARST